MPPAVRFALAAVLLGVTLAGCLSTGSDNYVVYEPGTSQKAKASAAKKSAAAAKPDLAGGVRAQLQGGCVLEHGGLLGGGEKIAKQCECFAGGVVKTMRKDDLEFYAQYKILPTLSVARPLDVKKQCGIAGV